MEKEYAYAGALYTYTILAVQFETQCVLNQKKNIPPVYLTFPLRYAIMQTTSDMGSRKQAAALRSYLKGVAEIDTFRYEQSVQPQ